MPKRRAFRGCDHIDEMVDLSGGDPVGDKLVDEGRCLLDLRDAAGFSEGRDLHEDRHLPENCARRVALIEKDPDITTVDGVQFSVRFGWAAMMTSATNSPSMTAIRPEASASLVCKTKMKAIATFAASPGVP